MTCLRTFGFVVAIAALVGCDGSTTITPDPDEFEWQATVAGTEGWEHLSGEAAFRWTEGAQTITAAIILNGDEPGAVRPWHVHHNTCAQGGAIVGEDEQYARLEIGADGSASVVTDVPIGVDPAAQFHVNVHLSNEEMDVFIACGDFTPLNAAAPGQPGEQPAPPVIPGY